MRRTQEITFLDVRHSTEWFPMPDAYTFAPKGRLAWLQRLAWRLLHKQAALVQAMDSRMKVERHVIHADSFVERIFKQGDSLLEEFDKIPERLLIGNEDYANLMNETAHSMPFEFNAQLRACRSGYDRPEMFGLKVQVVPWIRGMVVLP